MENAFFFFLSVSSSKQSMQAIVWCYRVEPVELCASQGLFLIYPY